MERGVYSLMSHKNIIRVFVYVDTYTERKGEVEQMRKQMGEMSMIVEPGTICYSYSCNFS